MPQFIDRHDEATEATTHALARLHANAFLDTDGVMFVSAWADVGTAYCLSEARDADAVLRVHASAGLEPDEVLPMTVNTPEQLATATTPDGSVLELQREGDEFVIRALGYDLMTSRDHATEESMFALACPKPPPAARVLIGGLGMGYTLGATLAALDAASRVVVAELVPDVVEWNRGVLGPLAGNPLADPRVEVAVGDVAPLIRDAVEEFDAILLDVDNGPDTLTDATNATLYGQAGLEAAYRALRPGGALAVWSVGDDPNVALPEYDRFQLRLRSAGFEPSAYPVEVGGRGRTHVVLVGRRPAA